MFGQRFLVPLSILGSGVLIAGALMIVNRNASPDIVYRRDGDSSGKTIIKDIPPVTSADHILGSPNAGVVIVEYADLECKYCKSFHNTMHRLVDEMGENGDIAWVFRHLPFVRLHSKAAREAEASECAAELGGNSGFWRFVDRLFDITPSDNNLDLALLPEIARYVGIDTDSFSRCLDSGRHREKVQESFDIAFAAGFDATPYVVLIAKDGTRVDLRGEQDYDVMKRAIEEMLVGNTPLFN